MAKPAADPLSFAQDALEGAAQAARNLGRLTTRLPLGRSAEGTTSAIAVRAGGRSPAPRAARAAISEPPSAPTARIFELSGKLDAAQVAALEPQLCWSSDAQLEHLATHTDLAAQSARFAQILAAKREVDRLFASYGSSDRHVRTALPRWLDADCLTPAMVAKLSAILLVGFVGRQLRDLPQQLAGLLRGEGWPNTPVTFSNARALQRLHCGPSALTGPARELFFRAAALELATLDEDLLRRLVDTLGPAAIRTAHPALDAAERATPETVAQASAHMFAQLSRVEPLAPYLGVQRLPRTIEAYAPSPATTALVAQAADAIRTADEYAQTHAVTLASTPYQLEQGRLHYRRAARAVRDAIKADRLAIQDPAIKAWIDRRGRALIVRQTLAEVCAGAGLGFARQALSVAAPQLPVLGQLAAQYATNASQPAVPALVEHYERALGFKVDGALTAKQAAQLVDFAAEQTLADAAADPLIQVLLEPELPADRSHIHLLFAPGVIPIGGVLESAFAHLEAAYGIKTWTAPTGLFESEVPNAQAVGATFDQILAADPDAKIVMLGYSQGTPNMLHLVDQRWSQSRAGQETIAAHLRGVVSLYGAHNGSPVADELLPQLRALVGKVLPFVPALEYELSSFDRIGRFFGGGIGSVKMGVRKRWWEVASLPVDVPYLSVVAQPRSPQDIPQILQFAYNTSRAGAAELNLPPENDSQILVALAPLGNDDTELGRAVRQSTTATRVRGHHWNALLPAHNPLDPAMLYAFPKLPQAEGHLLLLGELGFLD